VDHPLEVSGKKTERIKEVGKEKNETDKPGQ